MTSDPPDESSGGQLRPTSVGVVTVWAVVGLVGGWLLHPIAERLNDTAPIVTWTQVLALFLFAAILAGTALITHRALHVHRQRLEPGQAVNRLVLARASALVGALAAGAYVGYAVSWLGVDVELANQRAWRSVVAGVGGVAITITAVFLERACRVRSDAGDT